MGLFPSDGERISTMRRPTMLEYHAQTDRLLDIQIYSHTERRNYLINIARFTHECIHTIKTLGIGIYRKHKLKRNTERSRHQ